MFFALAEEERNRSACLLKKKFKKEADVDLRIVNESIKKLNGHFPNTVLSPQGIKKVDH